MISSLFTSKNSKELNSQNVETNNIKFGTYNNSYYIKPSNVALIALINSSVFSFFLFSSVEIK